MTLSSLETQLPLPPLPPLPLPLPLLLFRLTRHHRSAEMAGSILLGSSCPEHSGNLECVIGASATAKIFSDLCKFSDGACAEGLDRMALSSNTAVEVHSDQYTMLLLGSQTLPWSQSHIRLSNSRASMSNKRSSSKA